MGPSGSPFAARVLSGMRRRGMTLRGFCRAVALDPSFLSKVLSGKRSPPSEEAVLRRIAGVLGLDAVELIVSAGRIPAEWRALWRDPRLLRDIHALATGEAAPQQISEAAFPRDNARSAAPQQISEAAFPRDSARSAAAAPSARRPPPPPVPRPPLAARRLAPAGGLAEELL